MLDTMLLTDPSSWQVQQVIAFDWYDGPRSGFCCLIEPMVEFYFTLLDERATEDDLNDRLYSISELHLGSCEDLLRKLMPLGEPGGKVWCPIWQHSDTDYLKRVDAEIDSIIGDTTPSGIIIYSRDMIHFRGCWNVKDDLQAIDGWFKHFGL
jgi:hypothetical protein